MHTYTEAEIKALEQDAKAFRDLRNALGYIEAGEGQAVTICQDDATKSWGITCGLGAFNNRRRFHNDSLHQALTEAGDFYKLD